MGFGHEDRAGHPFSALGVHPGRCTGSSAPADFSPVRSVRYNTPCSVSGAVPGSGWYAGAHLSQRGLSIALPSLFQKCHSARLGNGRQHLPHWRHLPGQSKRDRAVQPDRQRNPSRRLDAAVWSPVRIRGRPPSPRPRLCALSASRCEKLTRSFPKRVKA